MTAPHADVPPFPQGSDWAAPAPDPSYDRARSRFTRRTGLTVLWASVLAVVAMTFVLVRADTVLYNGTNVDDTSAFDGMNAFAIVVLGVIAGMIPLVAAARYSIAAARRKSVRTSRAAGLVALYAAACGAAIAPYSTSTADDLAAHRRIEATAVTTAHYLYGAVALIALVPLALFLLAHLYQCGGRAAS
ncbi:MAG: hypothetical protein JWQ74_1014 [Marmoricola sp.]|nr:hypothetical protein [Marmoricola sp.]